MYFLSSEARGGFRSASSIVDELIQFVSCDEGGLHLQRRGAPTMQSMKANPRLMAKIRQAVARKDSEDNSKTLGKINKPGSLARKPANARSKESNFPPPFL